MFNRFMYFCLLCHCISPCLEYASFMIYNTMFDHKDDLIKYCNGKKIGSGNQSDVYPLKINLNGRKHDIACKKQIFTHQEFM